LTPRPDPPRKERTAVEFPEAMWTSFDRYARYGAIVRAVRANAGPHPAAVLDVGDNSGWLLTFDPELAPISVDLVPNPDPLDGTRAVMGDGARLPIRDRGVEVVVTSDALEHVPPGDRAALLRELARVSDVVVVAAPFDTPGVAGAEEFVRRYVVAATGSGQDQLDEHAAHGLPSLDDAVATLEQEGLQVATVGNGNLQDWLLVMLLKQQLGSTAALDDLDAGVDVLYNMLLAARTNVPPFYRHILIACRDRAPVVPDPPDTFGHDQIPTEAVQLALVTASTDLVARHRVWERTYELSVQLQTAVEHLMKRFSGVEAALAELHGTTTSTRSTVEQTSSSIEATRSTVESIMQLLRHPAKAMGRRIRKREPDGE
jgi:hypothetical protein